MDKQTFIYLLIEAIVFLIPIATLFIKLGKYIERAEKIETAIKEYPEWKATTDEKVNSKLYGFADESDNAIYLLELPKEDADEITVYIPAATGITTGTAAYDKASDTLTLSDTDYVRDDDLDVAL